MYSTKLVNKNMVDGNAYITVNDPYHSHVENPFRAPTEEDKKKPPAPFRVKVYFSASL